MTLLFFDDDAMKLVRMIASKYDPIPSNDNDIDSDDDDITSHDDDEGRNEDFQDTATSSPSGLMAAGLAQD